VSYTSTAVLGTVVNSTTLLLTGFPSSITAGTAATITVTAENLSDQVDTSYMGTVYFRSSDIHAGLPANYTFTSSDNGVHTFNVTLKTAGTQSITATDTVTGSIAGSETGITVNPAAASTLVVTGFTSPVTAGTGGTFTVTAKDPYNNTATGYLGTVHFTSSDGQAALPGNYPFTFGDSGVHTFSATLKTAGSQSITATDTTTATITGSQTSIMVNPAAASTFVVTGFTSPVTAGTPGTFTVTAKDPYNNTATGYLGTVRFTSSDGQAARPGYYAFTSGDNGVHTFSAILKTAGSQSLTATDTVTGSITGSQTGIMVNPAAASVFVVSGFPSPTAVGTPANFTVTAKDAYMNIATGYTGTVTFSSDLQALLPANAALTNGTGTFSATFNTIGTASLTATDTVTSTITGSESGIVIYSPIVATSLLVTGFSSPVTAGTQGSVTVTAENLVGQPATGYTGTVQFISSDTQAVLPANYTFTNSDNGTHTFSVTLKTAGTQLISATDTVTSSITGSQSGIAVTAGLPTQIRVNSGSGQSTPFGTVFAQPLVGLVTDSFDNPVPGVVVAFTPPHTGPGVSLTSATATTGANGQVSQSVTANGMAGSYNITAAIAGVANAAVFQLHNLPATISGTVFQDININGVQDPGEPGIAGQTVDLDLNGSGTLEMAATTDSSGNYQFTVSSAGTYTVRQVLYGGVLLDAPASGGNQVTLSSGVNVTGQNFAEVPTSITVPLTLPLNTPFPKQGNANADFVEALYRAILNRNAEPGGLTYWTGLLNSGALSRLQVVQQIWASNEHLTQEVTDFYFTLLDRAPDAKGLQSWVQALQHGMTEEQVAYDFLDSPEYLRKGDKYFVDHMYLSILGRTFDAPGEAYWLNALGDDSSGNPTHARTLTNEQVVTDFLYSPESLNRLVQGDYQIFLQRLADPQGLKYWLALLQQGTSFATIAQEFLSSDEFYDRAAAEG